MAISEIDHKYCITLLLRFKVCEIESQSQLINVLQSFRTKQVLCFRRCILKHTLPITLMISSSKQYVSLENNLSLFVKQSFSPCLNLYIYICIRSVSFSPKQHDSSPYLSTKATVLRKYWSS